MRNRKHSRFPALLGTLCIGLATLLGLTPQSIPAFAQSAVVRPERPLVFVPGLQGSRLCSNDASGNETVVWGTVDAIVRFPELAVSGKPDAIKPCGLIREISYLGVYTQDVYAPFIERLKKEGYREGETLFLFDYDWRLSAFDNAKELADFVDRRLPDGQRFDLVAHSFGGLVARAYALDEGGADRIDHLISAATPWRGSVEVFDLLQNGWGATNILMGGLDGFRSTILTFQSMFELMPRYRGCCGDSVSSADGFDARDAAAWNRLNWSAVDRDNLPDLSDLSDRQARINDLIARVLPASVEDVLVVGDDQRTPVQYSLNASGTEAQFVIHTGWEGDGTVARDSAVLRKRVTFPTSFATHESILNETSVQDFVVATLARGADQALRDVPVRERTSVLTSVGELVELIGVSVTADQPAYRAGSTVKVSVHVRLDAGNVVDARIIDISAVRPDGTEISVAPISDPQASDPTSPLEQSFSATVDTGMVAGPLTFTATLSAEGMETRQATLSVPVLAR
ncbi:lipase/acyltransferase domain-containing protein [Agrobacterium sp. ES01]|uniref:lipase/acyltransferase domain-containing protein n=1 Tax=Agrobacterium sp. ES01 TaxID=3420714 RepID=UPI003D134AE9